MRILVTGGAGFIGSHIADAYITNGHHVTVIDNLVTGNRDNLHKDAEFIEVDIRDRERIEQIFSNGKFDLVNHHAAQLDVRVSVRNPQFDAEQNIIGSLNLLQSAHQHGVGNVIFASSGGTVYGEQQIFPADETHPTEPISPYGVAKLSVEKYLGYYTHTLGIHHTVLRYTNVYGPRQNSHGEAGVIAIFCDRMFNGIQPVINGNGEQTRDYVYVGDVVDANVRAVAYMDAHASGTFNICTNTEVTVNELFNMLNDMLGGKFAEKHAPALLGEQLRSVCAYEKARGELGWEPNVGLREGLERTLQFFRGT